MESTPTTDYKGDPAVEWDLGGWEAAKAFVERNWPDAKHVGMGGWRIDNTARIVYSVGRVMYVPYPGRPMPTSAH